MSTQHADATPVGQAGRDTDPRLGALARAVVSAARSAAAAGSRGGVPEPHLGAELASALDPHSERLRAAGASFDWVAFSRPSTPMWDEHVGVVHVADDEYDVGIHLADRLSDAQHRCDRLAAVLGGTPSHSGRSGEHQVVVRRLRLPDQQDEAVRLSLDLLEHLSQQAG